jgi:hypothetical protein
MKYFLTIAIVLLNLFSSKAQINDTKVIDSIHKGIKSIKAILDDKEAYKEEINNLKRQQLRDSITLYRKDAEISNLLSSVENLKKEKVDLNSKKKELQDSLLFLKSDYSTFFDNQIEIFLKEEFDSKSSRLLLSNNSLKNFFQLAQKSYAKKLTQLGYFIEIYDSISFIYKLFDLPYNEIQTKEALKKIESLIILAKQKMPANKIVLSELENLSEKTKDYCKNTLDLFNHFYTYAAIAKQDANQFNNKAAMGYYYDYKYSYLLNLLNKFLDDPTYRSQFEDKDKKEQFKIKPPFTCN